MSGREETSEIPMTKFVQGSKHFFFFLNCIRGSVSVDVVTRHKTCNFVSCKTKTNVDKVETVTSQLFVSLSKSSWFSLSFFLIDSKKVARKRFVSHANPSLKFKFCRLRQKKKTRLITLKQVKHRKFKIYWRSKLGYKKRLQSVTIITNLL